MYLNIFSSNIAIALANDFNIFSQGARFCVQLFVRDTHIPSKFCVGTCLGELDILFNSVDASTQHLRGDSPWRGPREKSDDLMKTMIESLTSVGDIILDWNASTGTHSFLHNIKS